MEQNCVSFKLRRPKENEFLRQLAHHSFQVKINGCPITARTNINSIQNYLANFLSQSRSLGEFDNTVHTLNPINLNENVILKIVTDLKNV